VGGGEPVSPGKKRARTGPSKPFPSSGSSINCGAIALRENGAATKETGSLTRRD